MRADQQSGRGAATGEHVDEGTAHAWIDGALGPGEAARVAAHVEECERCAALVAEARGLVAASSRILRSLDDERSGVTGNADASVAAAFAGMMNQQRTATGDPGPPAPRAPAAGDPSVTPIESRRRRLQSWRWRIAAGVLVLAGGSALVLSDGDVRSGLVSADSRESAATAAADSRAASDSPAAVMSTIQPESVATDLGGAELERTPALTTPDEVSPVSGVAKAGPPRGDSTVPPSAAIAAAPTTPAEPSAESRAGALAESRSARGFTAAAPPPMAAPSPEPARTTRAMAARDADSSVAQRAEAASETLQLQGKVAGSRTADVRLLRGVVRDAGSQEPIAGAAVLVPGAAAAVVTDEEGRFALPVSPGDTSVVVRVIGFQPARLDLAQGAPLDSTTVMLQPDITLLEELAVTGADAAQRDVLLEAWLADGASPNDPRVTSVAGCWALVGGRVPGATEGVVLRLHGTSRDAGRSWVPLGTDSLTVRLAGGSELRVEVTGERMSGVSRRSGPAGTAAVPLEFARVRCDG